MFYIVYSTNENPLMTMGDAVASFLDAEDARTEKISLFNYQGRSKGYHSYNGFGVESWEDAAYEWVDTTSKRRRRINFFA